MARIEQELTAQQKIEIVKGAQKLLGGSGQNWIKGAWFGKKREDFVPGGGSIRRADDGHHILNFEEVSPSKADCWCVLGALEESAFRLGYIQTRRKSKVLGKLTSLKRLAMERLKSIGVGGFESPSVDSYNDHRSVEWKDVKKLLNDRIKQLQKEV